MRVNKNTVFLLLSIIILSLTIVLMFFPKAINYKHSYVNLTDKKDRVENNNMNLVQQERSIGMNINELELLEMDKDKIFKEAKKLKKQIKKEDFELDIPSFLISMEQNAVKNKVSLDIEYGQIKTISSKPEKLDSDDVMRDDREIEESEDTQEDDESNEENNESKENESKENESSDNIEISDQDSENFTSEQIEMGAIQIDGVDVTVVPMIVKGGYSNVRDYIEYLDEVGMIEPTSASLTSEGRNVEAKIILNIFHGEVF